MRDSVAIVGAGVSGLTCGVVLAEAGYRASIFAREAGQLTTSAVAGAIWFPYDAEPADKVIAWALETYEVLTDLARDPQSGVSMIELRTFARTGEIEIPAWAHDLGARRLTPYARFHSGFGLEIPLTDTTIYLDYLARRFGAAGGQIHAPVSLARLEDVSDDFELVINCAGIGARILADDSDLEPHRGQVAIVPKMDISCAIVADDAPLMYAIPRANDCVFGGTNEVSDSREVDPATTSRIVAECSRVLDITRPIVLAERVGLRPFRKKGVRVELNRFGDGRVLIHNYGHGGSGFTLSWGCAARVRDLVGAGR